MEKLLDAVAAVVCLISPEKVQAIAARIRRTEVDKVGSVLASIVGTSAALAVVEQLGEAWKSVKVSADELASMLLAASHTLTKSTSEQTIELVWTGPTTPFVSTRRTEQALLQVINSAKKSLFITSFVAYDFSTIVKALKMRTLVPKARLFAWREKADEFSNGRVHAKVAVADSHSCFITSANLTGYAMEKNMEAGVLLTGGKTPESLYNHLVALVDLKFVVPLEL